MVTDKGFAKKFSSLLFAVALVGLFALFVLAAAGDNIRIESPLRGWKLFWC